MTRRVLYVAHALRPTEEEIAAHELTIAAAGPSVIALQVNLQRAMAWLSWLRRSFPETTFIAPWIASVLAGADDSDPAQREAGFIDDCATIERCDGIVLCGSRISEGMRREMEHGIARGGNPWLWPFEVYDLTSLGAAPPAKIASGSPEHRAIAGLLLRDLQAEAGL